MIKAKLTTRGNIWLDKLGVLTQQECPYGDEVFCGLWCPQCDVQATKEYGKDGSGSHFRIQTCGELQLVRADEFLDERVKEEVK